MRLIWFLPLATAWSWLFLLSTFTPERFTITVPLLFPLAAGAAAASVSLGRNTRPLAPGAAWCFMPLLPVILLIPFPYNLGGFFLAGGLFLGLCAMGARHLAPVSKGLSLCGFILLVQGPLNSLFYVVGARFHELKILNLLAWPFVRLFSLPAGMSEAVIHLQTYKNMLIYPGTLEKTGAYLFFHLLLAGIFLLAFFGAKRATWLKFILITAGYGFVRYVFMIFIFARVQDAEMFWNPWSLGISYLPLVPLLAAWVPLSPASDPELFPAPGPAFLNKRNVAATLLFLTAGFAFTGIWGFRDPGTEKQGRILIDETRSDWEWSTRKFDTTWYGSRSTYNYYCMADYLDHFYKVSRNTDKKLTLDLISDYDILILKTPTAAYSEEEIESIVTYVEQGGGVWLIGDHTNVFGMSYYLNAIAKRFGMYFHYDSTYDLDKGTLNAIERPRVFPHPVVQRMPRFLFATGCTLDASLSADNVMLGYGLRSRMLSYSGRSFFEDKATQDYEFGLFLQSAGLRRGKGRVLLFSDSTCFSNFYMFIPGKPELAIGSIEWLNRKNALGFVPKLLFMVFIAATALGINLKKGEPEEIFGLVSFSFFCAAALGICFFNFLTGHLYAPPEAHRGFKTVSFEREHSDFTVPVDEYVEKHPKNYQTFFVWTQRKGFFPTLETTLESALTKGELTVLINPVKPFTGEDIRRISQYVEGGGRLLLLDGPWNRRSSSGRLLEAFDMGLENAGIKETAVFNRLGINMGTIREAGSVRGGRPILLSRDKKPLFSMVQKGKGALGVMNFSKTLSNPVMGGTQVRPTDARLKIYELMYYMIDTMEQSGSPQTASAE